MKKSLFKKIIAFVLVSFLFLIPWLSVRSDSIEDLNRRISNKWQEITKLQNESLDLEKKIADKKDEKVSLENQISILDNEIKKTEIEIEKTRLEIEKTEIEIEKVEAEIKQKEEEIARAKDTLAELVKIIYYYDKIGPLELIFNYKSFSEVLDQIEYLEMIEEKTGDTLDKIIKLKEELEWQNQVLSAKKQRLEELRQKLNEEKVRLNEEKKGKEKLLEETNAQEARYQELLSRARQEMNTINEEIKVLEQEIRKKLQELRGNQNFDWQNLGGDGTLAWPVNPSQGISAYFLDPNYEAVFGIPHYGIDIPTPQGTPLHAAAEGYVIKTRNAGFGYSYIVLLHSAGISTVYGHVSAIFVSEGMYVSQGDIIGLSGGTPGTPGAGWLTTGPHLHFETRVNGVPVDPLGFLP